LLNFHEKKDVPTNHFHAEVAETCRSYRRRSYYITDYQAVIRPFSRTWLSGLALEPHEI